MATLTGLIVSGWGWLTNLIVYLIEEFNVKSIDATQIVNVISGTIGLIPIIGAITADSFLGSFLVSISSVFSFLGAAVLTLTATLCQLRPQQCETGSNFCHGSSKLQLAVLYTGITLASIGLGMFLNRAALKTEGDIHSDGSVAKPWRICTVQQVEDLKTLIRIFPIWATAVFVSTPIAVQTNMTVLQALAMDRHLGPNFKMPAGSIIVVVLLSSAIFIALLDPFLFPAWQKLTGRSLTPLQRIGAAHAFNILSMAISALVESRRLKVAHDHHLQNQQGAIVPMLALWLFPQLVVIGIGEAFSFPGNVSFYYQEFPVSLKSTATAMFSLVAGIAYYVSTALVDLIRNVTAWLPDDINHGRLDNVYWTFVVLGLLNFGYFLVCAKLYKYRNLQHEVEGSSQLI
ncbi:hypothetical protein PTKIN_Ptkin03bG0024200 [Pterospermum kingtungense]